MKSFQGLVVWKQADDLAFEIYKITRSFPKDELYGITSQLRRAALSVPTNLAEGSGRQNKAETRQFANVALGSLFEVESLLKFSFRLGFLSQDDYSLLENQRGKVGALLWGFYRSFD